ncbi:MAG TPA: flagellar protein FliT [Limnobacter sp.]|uniref:flagellar protein FliT n=1 Tax=Limnobacter sp. TaxID=2003368 RepID=UPI002ED7FE5F
MMLNKEHNAAVMRLYAAIANQSQAMLNAAKEGDWDGLCAAEEHCSRLIHELQTIKEIKAVELDDRERTEHIGYLKKILADDAAIRNITEPRLRQLEEFLRAASNSQRLSNSYGSN